MLSSIVENSGSSGGGHYYLQILMKWLIKSICIIFQNSIYSDLRSGRCESHLDFYANRYYDITVQTQCISLSPYAGQFYSTERTTVAQRTWLPILGSRQFGGSSLDFCVDPKRYSDVNQMENNFLSLSCSYSHQLCPIALSKFPKPRAESIALSNYN